MNPEDSSLEQDPSVVVDSAPESAPLPPVQLHKSRFSNLFIFRYNKAAFLFTGLSLLLIILIGLVGLLFNSFHSGKIVAESSAEKVSNYAVSNVSLNSIKTNQQLSVNGTGHLAVNGQLQVTNTLVLAPTTAPNTPTSGQIYYNQSTNTPYYYNGSQFIDLAPTATPQHVTSLGGTSGTISVGNGLQVTSGQLSLTDAALLAQSQDQNLDISSPTFGQVLQYNGVSFTNSFITNNNLQGGDFSNINGVGTLTQGSIGPGFGTISTVGSITTTATVQAGTITSGLINGQTIGSTANFTGTLAVSTLGTNGSSLLCYNASYEISSCSASTGSSSYIFNDTNTQQDANFNIQSESASDVGGVIEGDASQQADLLDFQNSSGSVLSGFTSSGSLQGGNSSGPNANGLSLTIAGGQGTGTGNGGNIALEIASPSSTPSSNLNGLDTVALISGTTGGVTLQNAANSANALQIENASGTDNTGALFDLSTVAPIGNLITNGSFEQDTNGWLAKGNMTISQVSGVGAPYGSYALQITNNGTPALLNGAMYPVTLSSNTAYSFAFYAKLASGTFTTLTTGWSNDGVTDSTCSTRGVVNTNTLSTTYWTRVTCGFTTGTITGPSYVFIGQNDTTDRTWYVDGVSLAQVSSGSFYTDGTLNLNGLALGNTLIQPSTSSNAAFMVAATNGNTGLQVDTINSNLNTDFALLVYNRGQIQTTSTTALEVRNGTSDAPLIQFDTTNVNLDTNGSFEYSTVNPPVGYAANHAGVTVTVDTTASNAYVGNNTGKIVSTTSAVANSGIQYPLTLTNNDYYTLNFFAKVPSGGIFTTLDAGWSANGSTENTCTLNSTAVTTYWQRYTCTFQVTGGTSGSPYFFIGQSDASVAHTYYLDGVEFEVGTSSAGPAFDNYREGKIQLNGDIISPTVFRPQSDSTSAFQIQNASGSDLLSVDSADSIITVSGTTSTFATLNLNNSHLESSQTNPPTINTPPTNCGSGTGPSAAVTTGSTDSAGSFTITTGSSGSPTTCNTIITFNKSYGSTAPKSVIVTASTTVGSASNERVAYVSAVSGTSFTVSLNPNLNGNTPGNSEVLSFYYLVVQ